MIIATTPYIAGHRVAETKGQVFGLVVRSRGFGGNFVAGLRSHRRRRDPRVHEPARGHPPPGHRPHGPERDPGGRQRGRVDALRLAELAGTMSEIVAYGTAVVIVPETAVAAPGSPPAPPTIE